MHIADGVLRPEVLIGGYAVAGLATAASIARFDERRIPQVAVLTSLFFVASLIHVPLGTTSVHLLLVGLLGIVLGRLSFPVVLVGLFLQALLLGHGGITTLGVNSVTMGSGALAASAVFETIGRAGRSRGWLSAVAFVASLAGTLVASAMYLGAMALGGRDLALVAEVTLIPNLVVSVLDGLVAASTVSFLAKVKPEVLGGVRARALAAIAAALVLGPREVQAHGVRLEAWREGKMVVVAAEFTDGTAVQGAEATVIPVGAEPGAPPLARGRTDSRGLFEFDPGLEATVVVVVADDAGHRVQRELEVGGGLPQGRPRRGFLEERGALLLPAAAGVLAIGLSALVLRLALRCFASRRRRAS